jgi:hypothetical protein
MSEIKEIGKVTNVIQMVGTLKEINIELKEEHSKRLFYGEGKSKDVVSRAYVKTDWKTPSFLIEVNGRDIEVDMYGLDFGVGEAVLKDDGSVDTEKTNKNFKSLETISKFIPKSDCKEDEKPTRVIVEGYIKENNFVTQEKEFGFKTVVMANKISHTSVPDEDKCDCAISGVIRSMKHEMSKENEGEETGRLLIDFYYFDSKKNIAPFPMVVESDLAEAVEEIYKPGDSCKLYYEILSKRIGGRQKSSEGGFGRRDANITTGYVVTEFSVFKGNDPFEEEDAQFLSIEQVKEAMKARDLMIETKIADYIKKQKEKSENAGKETKTSPKGAAKGRAAAAGVGRRNVEDEAPFDKDGSEEITKDPSFPF